MPRLSIPAGCVVAVVAVLAALPAAASEPAHRPARPKAYVLTIHGGGWYRVGPRMAARMAADDARLRGWGYGAVNVDYRAGRRAFPDVLAAYDRLRRRVGRRAAICALGSSAGAQMALMLAIRRPALACVVSQAAPALLRTLSPHLRALARGAFGAGRLAAWSPALYALRTPLLIEQARHDPVVAFANALALRRADPRSRLVAFDRGTEAWIHTTVDALELARAHALERTFLGRWTSGWPGPPARPPRFAG